MFDVLLRKIRTWKYTVRVRQNQRLYEQEMLSKPIAQFEAPKQDLPAIDVVIPAIEKDFEILPLVVQGIRANVLHPIIDIHIVGPPSNQLTEFCRKNGCKYFDESRILTLKPQEINYRPLGVDRSGWIFQQFIKLSGQIGTQEWIVACDADTVLLRPHSFVHDQKHLFYVTPQWVPAYGEMYFRLFGRRVRRQLSFVHHCVAYNRSRLADMRKEMEVRFCRPWFEAIISQLDPGETSSIAEQQTYGNWIAESEEIMTLPARNLEVDRGFVRDYETLTRMHNAQFKSITFHAWMNA